MSEYQDSGRREENIQDEVVRLTAERDRYMAEASERQREIGRLEAERDALAAQLERDCNALNCLIDDERAANQTLAAQCAALAEECGANPNDIPAAAARFTAAERVAKAVDACTSFAEDDAGILAIDRAHQEWRKAVGK